MANFDQTTAAGMQQAAIGNHAGPNVMVNHHLNDIPRSARRAKQRLGHRPGADVMLDIDRHAGMRFQGCAQRHIGDVIERHAVNDAIFGINNTWQRNGDCR